MGTNSVHYVVLQAQQAAWQLDQGFILLFDETASKAKQSDSNTRTHTHTSSGLV